MQSMRDLTGAFIIADKKTVPTSQYMESLNEMLSWRKRLVRNVNWSMEYRELDESLMMPQIGATKKVVNGLTAPSKPIDSPSSPSV